MFRKLFIPPGVSPAILIAGAVVYCIAGFVFGGLCQMLFAAPKDASYSQHRLRSATSVEYNHFYYSRLTNGRTIATDYKVAAGQPIEAWCSSSDKYCYDSPQTKNPAISKLWPGAIIGVAAMELLLLAIYAFCAHSERRKGRSKLASVQ